MGTRRPPLPRTVSGVRGLSLSPMAGPPSQPFRLAAGLRQALRDAADCPEEIFLVNHRFGAAPAMKAAAGRPRPGRKSQAAEPRREAACRTLPGHVENLVEKVENRPSATPYLVADWKNQ